MKVKIGDAVYDANDQPIMLILEGQDKENIWEMLPECTKYCVFPAGSDRAEIEEFMKTSEAR